MRGAWGEARLRGRERNNDSKTVFLTRWNRSCPCTAWERGRLARMPGTRASRPAWERGRLARRPGTRASRPAWERGHLAPPGRAGILPARSAAPQHGCAGILPSTAPRGQDVLYRRRFLGCACVPSLVLVFRTPKIPLLPQGEKGVGGMRGKSAQECRKLCICGLCVHIASPLCAPGCDRHRQALWQQRSTCAGQNR